MMAQKHLRELLQEDQEPFLLKNYIDDRRFQFKRPSPNTQLKVKKQRPVSPSSSFPANFCKNACLFSFHESPDLKKSPFFSLPSSAKSPCRSPNTIFLHIPARTASLLLEAALRIQKQSSSSPSKAKPPQNKSNGFGLFGSILKRLTHRNRNRKREIVGDGVKVSVKDILRWDSSVGRNRVRNESRSNEMKKKKTVGVEEEKSAYETGFSCSCNGRPSSAVWSDSNEEKSLDTSSSSQSDDYEEIEFASKIILDSAGFASCDNHFCESPFHFVLQRSPSPGRRTRDFSSPASSPSRRKTEDKENYEVESLKKLQVEEEEEDKEQCSPVSVLDPPFEDDDDGHVDDADEDNNGFDLECSYAIVQRAKKQLLHKLRRFEKLAGLDPVELEKRILESEQDEDEDIDNCNDTEEDEENSAPRESVSFYREPTVNEFVNQVLKSNFKHSRRIPGGIKRLVSDLVREEEEKCENGSCLNREVVVKRVCKRLDSWKEVESNTIDMMVEQDFTKELDGWKKNQEQVQETALEIEFAIFGILVEELSDDLVSLT